MHFYSVARGRNIGIYTSFNDCYQQIYNFNGAIYKKFKSEKDAEHFILHCNNTNCHIYQSIYSRFNDDLVDLFVYTDGSCYNNPGIKPFSAIGIFFSTNNKKNLSLLLNDNSYLHTSNTAELKAIIICYYIIKPLLKQLKICIVSDSEYAIKAATSAGDKYNDNNWNDNIPHKKLVKQIYKIYKNNPNLKFKHIKAHTTNNDIHSIGNRNADKLAYSAIQNHFKNISKLTY